MKWLRDPIAILGAFDLCVFLVDTRLLQTFDRFFVLTTHNRTKVNETFLHEQKGIDTDGTIGQLKKEKAWTSYNRLISD